MTQQQKQVEQNITKNMTIGEVVHTYPSVTEILLAEGVHCIGCGAAYDETIEQGLSAHGKTEQEINDIISKLNSEIPSEKGNSNSIIVTEKAIQKLKEILKQSKKENAGLRIKIVTGGCSGYQYAFDFEEKKQKDDLIIEVSEVKFYVDQQSFEMLQGAKLDYVEAFQGAGFKISNPNAQHSCGCGQSFH